LWLSSCPTRRASDISLLRSLGPATAFGWNRSAPGADAAHAAGFEVSTDLPATLRRAADRDALVVVGVPLPALGPVLDAVAEHAPDRKSTRLNSSHVS